MANKKEPIVREIHLSGLNESIHLLSTDPKENLSYLLKSGLKAMSELKTNGDKK